MKATLVTLVALLGFAASTVTYDGYKVYKVHANTNTQIEFLKQLETSSRHDFWSPVNKIGEPVVLMVQPSAQGEFEWFLNALEFSWNVEIENVQTTVEAEREYHRLRTPVSSGRISFDQYLQIDEINAYLAQVEREHPSLVSVETIGRSYENRPINLVRISTNSRPKPQIYIEGGIHAREWISPAVVLYLITQLVDPQNRNLIENVNWLIIPSINPDGYQYTFDSERLWRKTRSPGTLCYGTDANRNFDFHWLEAGASSWECSETYAGRTGFSEVEAQALRDNLLNEQNIELFLSVHSYGQYLLYSWGWTATLPDNWQELQQLAEDVDDAIAAINNTRYRIGSSTNVLYSASGNSVDWAKGVGNVPLSYTIELPGGGSYGFDLPASRILPVAIETFEGFKVFGKYIANKFGK